MKRKKHPGARPSPSERLQALYDTLPTLHCQGKCAAYCGIIPLTPLEARRIQDRLGRPLACDREGRCGALDAATGRCLAYTKRPTICRLWGVCKGMLCPYGCTPERVLTQAEALDYVTAAMDISEEEGFTADSRLASVDLHDPEVGAMIEHVVALDHLLSGGKRPV